MKIKLILFLAGLLLFSFFTMNFAQSADNLNSLSCKLPDPLLMKNGTRVKDNMQWQRRRKELLEFFTHEMYGVNPGRPQDMRFNVWEVDRHALNGIATRKQIVIYFNGKEDGPKMDVLLYLPNAEKRPVPVFLGLNFWGNHAINADPCIKISETWIEGSDGLNPYVDLSCVKDHHATEACRGINSSQWPIEEILKRGYGLVTAYRGDIDHDFYTGFNYGVYALYSRLQNRSDNFCAMSAWAWSLSRIMDYLESDKDVDATKVALFGWSRLGKAALWAAAQDQRFAMFISIQSGSGGVKLFHTGRGENIRRLCTVFPHWFCSNFRKYMDKDTCLPFDQHMVLSLIAPRPIYISSAVEDNYSDPMGEFESAKAVSAVYRFLGKKELFIDPMPPVFHPIFGQIGYHIREGKHDVLPYDWEQYLKFADIYLKIK